MSTLQTPVDPPPGYSAIAPVHGDQQQQQQAIPYPLAAGSSSSSSGHPQHHTTVLVGFSGPSVTPPLVQPHYHHHGHDHHHQPLLLPIYDPRISSTMASATSRARWRFFYSFLWALGIWVTVGVITGGIVIDVRTR